MNPQHFPFDKWLASLAAHTEQVLKGKMPQLNTMPAGLPGTLYEAMEYAVLGGGKRVRAALVYAAGMASQTALPSKTIESSLDKAAAAVELIHAYSLVHDDLPCMDNDVLRRGRATVHIQFDEAIAMLVGDALQPLAFELLSEMTIAPVLVVQAVRVLTRASGSLGMAGGQAIDLKSVGCILSTDELKIMHNMKTGAMLEASVALGGIVTGANSSVCRALKDYGQAIGLAFQVVDDILDVTANTTNLGKTAGKDAVKNKPTYVSLMGLTGARVLAKELYHTALESIASLGTQATRLAELASFIVRRDR